MSLRDIWNLHKLRPLLTANLGAVKLGSIMFCPSSEQVGGPAEIAFFPKVKVNFGFVGPWVTGTAQGALMENGWTRCNASNVLSVNMITLHRTIETLYEWLIQANYIFSHLGITSNFQDYCLMFSIDFEIFVSENTQECPEGFLFLCPVEDFEITPTSFCWPEDRAYWSRDPSGGERLSAEEATNLGFPSLKFNTRIKALSWDSSVYDGLRQFQIAQGFDPDTQEYAQRSNYSLCRFSADTPNAPNTHVGKGNKQEQESKASGKRTF
ncbi:hypothetical protein B0H19DRAFT_1197395 [Mycena capillaripes]|nr:hypothetical protein B0H19DRAFT_1197395 [Mycena capillaripes]